VRLGLDVGASRIKAVLAWPDGTATKVMFGEASPLDAAVVVDRRGRVRAGSAAERAARDVAGVVPYPLLLADAPVQVGAISVSAVELLAAPLRHPWSFSSTATQIWATLPREPDSRPVLARLRHHLCRAAAS
jgi:hypothetical protein